MIPSEALVFLFAFGCVGLGFAIGLQVGKLDAVERPEDWQRCERCGEVEDLVLCDRCYTELIHENLKQAQHAQRLYKTIKNQNDKIMRINPKAEV